MHQISEKQGSLKGLQSIRVMIQLKYFQEAPGDN